MNEEKKLDLEELDEIEDEILKAEEKVDNITGTSIISTDLIEDETEDKESGVEEKKEAEELFYVYSKPQHKSKTNLEKLDISKLRSFLLELSSQATVLPGQLIICKYKDKEYKTTEYKAGKNTYFDEKTGRIFSLIEGQIFYNKDNTVDILPVKRFSSDITTKEGNIKFEGNLVINGSIEEGVKVEAQGNIFIKGNIGKSQVISGGDLFVLGGIKGEMEKIIKAKGDVLARFIENSNVSSEGSVIVEEAILNSKIIANASIILTGKKRIIAGGELHAKNEINCRIIGSESYITTKISVGILEEEREKYNDLMKKKNSLETAISSHRKNLATLKKIKQDQGQLSADKEQKLNEIEYALEKNTSEYKQILEQIKTLEESISEITNSKICVEGTTYPGTNIEIGNIKMVIKSLVKYTKFIEKNGKITQDMYDKPKFKKKAIKLEKTKEDKISESQLDSEEKHGDFTEEIQEYEAEQIKDESAETFKKLRKNIVLEVENDLEEKLKQSKILLKLHPKLQVAKVVIGEKEKQNIVEKKLQKKRVKDLRKTKQKQKKQIIQIIRFIEVKPNETPKIVESLYSTDRKKGAVQLRCFSVKEGLEKASKYFKVDPKDLLYKVIDRGSKGILGIGRKPYIIEAKIRIAEPEEKSKTLLGLTKTTAEEEDVDADGMFSLDNKKEGLLLTAYPASGKGKKITIDQVLKELTKKGYKQDINEGKIEEAITSPRGGAVYIGPRQPEPGLDGSVEVTVTKDKLKAFLKIIPPKPGGLDPAREKAFELVERLSIKDYNIDKINDAFEKKILDTPILIAQGREAKNGIDGRLEMKIKDKNKIDVPADSKSRVSFKDIQFITTVKEGELLAQIIEPVPGEDGITVNGDRIPAKEGKRVIVTIGKNVKLDENEGKIYATRAGQPVILGKLIKVEPVYEVRGDVDYSVGSINFNGTVIINGTIKEGFTVKASEDIFVGYIENTEVESGGNITVYGGILGKNQGKVIAKGDIIVRYIENAYIESQGKIIVKEEILNSRVLAKKSITLKEGKKQIIIGGKVSAGRYIDAGEIGSSTYVKTEIEAGIDPFLKRKLENVEENLSKYKKHFDKIKLAIRMLISLKEKQGGLAPGKIKQLNDLISKAKTIGFEVNKMIKEIDVLKLQIEKSKPGKIAVRGKVHPGVKITLNLTSMFINEEYNFVTYSLAKGDIVIGSYYELTDTNIENIEPEEEK